MNDVDSYGDPQLVELTAVAAALEAGEGFFVNAPIGIRGSVRKTIQAAADAQNRDIVIHSAWAIRDGEQIVQDGGDLFYVLPGGIRPIPGVS